MPYKKITYYCGETIEVEKKHTGRYGAPGQKRQKKRKQTKEEIAKQNERLAVQKLRRKINTNFGADDYHIILTYRPEERPDPGGARKELARFFRNLKSRYHKHGDELKYVVVTEYKKTAIHHHLIINSSDKFNAVAAVRECWPRGRPKFVPLDDEGDYRRLAEYFVKETAESFRSPDNPNKKRYSCSRNLKEPKVSERIIRAGTFREDPKPPKGWYIDKDTLYTGINPVTGYRYQYYTMRKLRPAKLRGGGKDAGTDLHKPLLQSAT